MPSRVQIIRVPAQLAQLLILATLDLEFVVRPRHTRKLAVWMNGEEVGPWRVPALAQSTPDL